MRFLLFVVLGCLWMYITARRRARQQVAARNARARQATTRRRHGLTLPVSRVLPQHRFLDERPVLEGASAVELLVDDEDHEGMPAPLERWREEAPYLLDAGDVVEPATVLHLVVDYPLARPVAFTLEASSGFSRLELYARICEVYEQLYEVEERTTTTPIGTAGTLTNRNRTDGTFGISMHALSDLVLEGVLIGSYAGERWALLEVGS